VDEARELAVGDRVRVFGGYDMDPEWLAASTSGYEGRVGAFIPGQNDRLAAVVELDSELILEQGAGAVRGQIVRGRFLVLELGHTGTDWATPEPRVHVELCEDAPPPTRWQDRVRGAWVESHATYRIVNEHP
jgi:hypothetical protein